MAQAKNPLKDKMNDDELDLSICNYVDKDVPVKDIALLKRATKLDLSNNKLTGLPKSFATLTHLVKLDLSCNLIVELPANFGELDRLKHLDLYNNKLTHLPLSFHRLTSLRWLDLKNNQLSSQLAAAAGECLNPKECEQCARRVVQFMGRVKEHYDQERIRRQQHEQELMQAKLAAEEAEKERLRLEKKAKKEKKKEELRQRKIENLHHHHPDDAELKTSRVEDKSVRYSKAEKGGGLSFVSKLNVALLVTALALVGGAVYLQQRGSSAPSGGLPASLAAAGSLARQQAGRALDMSLRAFQRVSELGTGTGDLLVERAMVVWRWAGELAAQCDLYLTDALGETWLATKTAAGDAGSALARLSRRAGEQTLALLSYAIRRGWESAGPLWESACGQATRLRHNAGPLLLEWTETIRRALVNTWTAVQRDAPDYAAAAWAVTCRLGLGAWKLCCDGWELVSTQVPVYASLAAESVTKLVAAVTGG